MLLMAQDAERTAPILMGYRNDYCAPGGARRSVFEETARVGHILANTVALLQSLSASPIALMAIPTPFTPGCRELSEPAGILRAIKRDRSSARSPFQQDYFFDNIFPLYARTRNSRALLTALGLP